MVCNYSFFRVIIILFLSVLFCGCPGGITLTYEVGDLTIIPLDGKVFLSWVEPEKEKAYDRTLLFLGEVSHTNKELGLFHGELNPSQTYIENLENGVEYTFLIAVMDKFGNESPGLMRKVVPRANIRVDEISDFQAKKGQGKIILSWINPGNKDFSKAEVWITDRNGVSVNHLLIQQYGAGELATLEIGKLENGYNYNFFIKAVDIWGNSSKIEYISASPDGTPPPTPMVDFAPYLVKEGENHIYTPTEGSFPGEDPTPWMIGEELFLKWEIERVDDYKETEIWCALGGMSSRLHQVDGNFLTEDVLDTRIFYTYRLKGLVNGQSYKITLSSVDNVGNSANADSFFVIPRDGVPCEWPLRVESSVANKQILVSWDNPKDSDFSHGTIQLFAGNPLIVEGTLVVLERGVTDYLFNNLVNDKSYSVELLFYDSSLNISEEPSGSGGNPLDTLNNLIPNALAVPDVEDLKIGRQGERALLLSWSKPDLAGASLIQNELGKKSYYVAYCAEVGEPFPPKFSDLYEVGSDGVYSKGDSVKIPFLSTGARWIPIEEMTDDYQVVFGDLTNGIPYAIKIFVVGVQSAQGGSLEKAVFSGGRSLSLIPDIPAGTLGGGIDPPVNVTIPFIGGSPTDKEVEMSYLPAGSFEMGISFYAEKVHTVTLTEGFWIGRHEISYGIWRTVYEWAIQNGYAFGNPGMVSNGESALYDIPVNIDGRVNSSGEVIHSSFYNLPVVYINWCDALVWINALTEWKVGADACVYRVDDSGKEPIRDSRPNEDGNFPIIETNMRIESSRGGFSLPTEAQWEYAARYLEDDKLSVYFMYGHKISGDFSYYKNPTETAGFKFTQCAENAEGKVRVVNFSNVFPNYVKCLYMSGNVAEWCYDWYFDYSGESVEDPYGATSSPLNLKVTRGGSYVDYLGGQGSSFRGMNPLDKKDLRIGFRIARSKKNEVID